MNEKQLITYKTDLDRLTFPESARERILRTLTTAQTAPVKTRRLRFKPALIAACLTLALALLASAAGIAISNGSLRVNVEEPLGEEIVAALAEEHGMSDDELHCLATSDRIHVGMSLSPYPFSTEVLDLLSVEALENEQAEGSIHRDCASLAELEDSYGIRLLRLAGDYTDYNISGIAGRGEVGLWLFGNYSFRDGNGLMTALFGFCANSAGTYCLEETPENTDWEAVDSIAQEKEQHSKVIYAGKVTESAEHTLEQLGVTAQIFVTENSSDGDSFRACYAFLTYDGVGYTILGVNLGDEPIIGMCALLDRLSY